MNKKRAFTLVELMIVLTILGIMAGTVSQIWFRFERMDRSIHRNTQFHANGHRVLERIAQDIRLGSQIAFPEGSLIQITQWDRAGQSQSVVYRLEEKQIVRDLIQPGQTVTQTVFTTTMETLQITQEPSGLVTLTWTGTRRDQPLQMRTKKLITKVAMEVYP